MFPLVSLLLTDNGGLHFLTKLLKRLQDFQRRMSLENIAMMFLSGGFALEVAISKRPLSQKGIIPAGTSYTKQV